MSVRLGCTAGLFKVEGVGKVGGSTVIHDATSVAQAGAGGMCGLLESY